MSDPLPSPAATSRRKDGPHHLSMVHRVAVFVLDVDTGYRTSQCINNSASLPCPALPGFLAPFSIYDAGMLHDRGGGNPPTKPPRRGSMRGRPGTRSFLLVSPTKWSFPCRQLKTLIGGATKFASRRQSRQRSSSKTYYNRREKRERRDRTLTPSANYEPFVNTVRIGDERDQFSLVYGNFQHRGRSQN